MRTPKLQKRCYKQVLSAERETILSATDSRQRDELLKLQFGFIESNYWYNLQRSNTKLQQQQTEILSFEMQTLICHELVGLGTAGNLL